MDKARKMARGIAVSECLELVDAEWKGSLRGGVLRVYIDGPQGITHAHCERVSRRLSAALDVEDLVPADYSLEVSSPGLDRRLASPADFRRFTGKRAKVRTRGHFGGSRTVTGQIEGCSREVLSLTTAGGKSVDLRLGDVEQARLTVDWQSGKRRV